MVTMKLMRQAIKNYTSPYVPKQLNRRNQRQWLAAVERLGDKWLYAQVYDRQSIWTLKHMKGNHD